MVAISYRGSAKAAKGCHFANWAWATSGYLLLKFVRGHAFSVTGSASVCTMQALSLRAGYQANLYDLGQLTPRRTCAEIDHVVTGENKNGDFDSFHYIL